MHGESRASAFQSFDPIELRAAGRVPIRAFEPPRVGVPASSNRIIDVDSELRVPTPGRLTCELVLAQQL